MKSPVSGSAPAVTPAVSAQALRVAHIIARRLASATPATPEEIAAIIEREAGEERGDDYAAECAVRFLQAAGRGRTLKGSGGECRAYSILVALVNHAWGLDSELITGLGKFAEFASADWPNAVGMAERFAGKMPKQRHPGAR